MNLTPKKVHLFLSTVLFLFCSLFSFSQQSTEQLGEMFSDYEVYDLEMSDILTKARSGNFFEIEIPKPDGTLWTLELHDAKIIADDYISQAAGDNGIVKTNGTTAIPTTGYVKGDYSTLVSLTFNDDFIYGYIRDEDGYFFIEPLSYYSNKNTTDKFVMYNANDILDTAPKECGVTEMANKKEEQHNHIDNQQRSVGLCFEVDYAIANDFLMFQSYGSVIGAENHAIGVTNNVNTDYDDSFADEVQFIIVTQFTPTTAASDPWTTSTNAGTLLNDFTGWGPSGFGVTHDVATLWTDRNFNGGTVGIAWLSVICSSSRYNTCQDFTGNANSKRVLVSHELGHNFSSGHDAGGGFIMSPSVNNTTTWSAQSINSINNHIATRTCLASCTSGSAPVADFSFNVISDCTPGEVVFTSNSPGATDYEWNFPGGTPSVSTDPNPTVFYTNAGTFNVTLTVTNAFGSDDITQNSAISIQATPDVDFFFTNDEALYSFFNLTVDANSFLWDFGDGFTSTDSDPVHDFVDDGVYIVTLTAFSNCGDITQEEVIVVVTSPTADFQSDVVSGCADLEVQYNSLASDNTVDLLWSFPGGTPNTSTEENPVITYTEAGLYDVELTVSNSAGVDVISSTNYLEVQETPLADFSFNLNGNEVTFTDFSVFADEYIWDFGDGNSSTDPNPIHTYTGDGDFLVLLTVINDCGENTVSTMISISLAPQASFQPTGSTVGCAPFDVSFESTSSNSPTSFEWTFPGGNPATSTDENPTVTYNASGNYSVTLMVTNANGSNSITMQDFVTVLDEPTSDFTFAEFGLQVNFTDLSIDADDYSWDFGDGNISTEQNPSHVYAQEGIYTVLLTTTNMCGSTTSQQTINNYSPVMANFFASSTEGCADFVVDFMDASSDNVESWMWEFEGGSPTTSTDENPTISYSQEGSYSVTLTVSHPESSETITFQNFISVSDVPSAGFTFFDDLFDVSFTNTSVGGDSFAWDFGDGNTSVEENPSYTYSDEGNYTVTLVVQNGCGSTEVSQTVTINNLPTAGFSATNSTGCSPLSVQYMNTSSSNAESFNWTFPGGSPASSTMENPTVTYNTPGTYNATLEVSAAGGTDVLVIENIVTVLDEPTLSFDFGISANQLDANFTGSNADNVTWIIDGIDIPANDIVFEFSENGTFPVTVVAENDCGSVSETFNVTIDAFVESTFSIDQAITLCVGEELTLTDDSRNATSWLWSFGGGSPATSTENSVVVSYVATGTYSITLEVGNDLGSETILFQDIITVIDVPTGSFTGEIVQNTVNFTSDIQGATSFLWDFGNGETSTEENPSHVYTMNGVYTVTLTASNECGETVVIGEFAIVSNSVFENGASDLNIYPNPTSHNVTISLTNNESETLTVEVLDIQGRLVMKDTFNSESFLLQSNRLENGTYLVRILSERNSIFRKLIVAK